MHTRATNSESHLSEMLIFPIDLLDDLIVAIKDFIPMSLFEIEALVGAAFVILCSMIAITTAKELYDDLKRGWNIEIEAEEERIMRHRRIKRNIPKLVLALGGVSLGLSMIIGSLGHILALSGIGIAAATTHFFPFAIMAALTIASAIALAKSVADFRDAKAAYHRNPYDLDIEKRYKAARNKVIFDSIDTAACATITTCLGIIAFGALAGASVMGLGIPLLIIIVVAAIAIIAKIIEHRETFKAGFIKMGDKFSQMGNKISQIGDKVGTLFSCHKNRDSNKEQKAEAAANPVQPPENANPDKHQVSGLSFLNRPPSVTTSSIYQPSNEQLKFGQN